MYQPSFLPSFFSTITSSTKREDLVVFAIPLTYSLYNEEN
jgi:hypothetical protein